MSKIKEARDWLIQARDVRKTKKARYLALDNVVRAKKEAKTSWKKIEPGLDVEALRREIKSYRRSADGPRVPKDGVCKFVRELLVDTHLAYAEIRTRALERFPEANTSTKSIASLARDMKKRGVAVPPRKGKTVAEERLEDEDVVELSDADLVFCGIFSPHGDSSHNHVY